MAAIRRDLTGDLIAEVLRRLPPRSLAVSRGVCRAWRDLVDDRRLLRADLLPRSVGGIFMNYCGLYSPEFFSRPTTGPSISGDLEFIPGFSKVVDHCNGLLLVSKACDYYVANPATRRWARLPPSPSARQRPISCDQIECLVYDPTVSPHYKVFLIPSLPDKRKPKIDPEMMQSEWPPSSLQVFSSITGSWEERSFALEEGSSNLEERLFVLEGRRMVQTITHTKVYWRETITHTKVYWREALYVLCKNGFVLRISMSKAKYRLIPSPSDVEFRYHGSLSLGRSEKGVYCALQHDWHGLIIFLLNESRGQVGWELKHHVDLRSFARKFHARGDSCQQHKGPWILQDINYYKYPYDNDERRELVDDNFEWNSDDDDVLNTDDMVEGHFEGHTGLLGFHPYKEIVFLDAALDRTVAYHWNTSKFQDLGNIFPKEYHEAAGHCAEIETSFTYTPCWMDDFPENNFEARIEN